MDLNAFVLFRQFKQPLNSPQKVGDGAYDAVTGSDLICPQAVGNPALILPGPVHQALVI